MSFLLAVFAPLLLQTLIPAVNERSLPHLLYNLIDEPLYILGIMAVPISVGFSALRHRLWDIDLLGQVQVQPINRPEVEGPIQRAGSASNHCPSGVT